MPTPASLATPSTTYTPESTPTPSRSPTTPLQEDHHQDHQQVPDGQTLSERREDGGMEDANADTGAAKSNTNSSSPTPKSATNTPTTTTSTTKSVVPSRKDESNAAAETQPESLEGSTVNGNSNSIDGAGKDQQQRSAAVQTTSTITTTVISTLPKISKAKAKCGSDKTCCKSNRKHHQHGRKACKADRKTGAKSRKSRKHRNAVASSSDEESSSSSSSEEDSDSGDSDSEDEAAKNSEGSDSSAASSSSESGSSTSSSESSEEEHARRRRKNKKQSKRKSGSGKKSRRKPKKIVVIRSEDEDEEDDEDDDSSEESPEPPRRRRRNKASKKKGKKRKSNRHSRRHRRDESSDDDEASTDDSDADSESDESDEPPARSSRKRNSKKSRKRRARRSRRHQDDDDSDESSDSEDDASDESDDPPARSNKKRRSKKTSKKRKPRRSRRHVEDSESQASADSDPEDEESETVESTRKSRRGGGRRNKKKGSSGSGKKKSRAATADPLKPQFFRGDELWDREIHAYKLTATADAADEDEYGEYVFHVRRRFDWEGKYTDTVVDIKSKALREALKQVMGSCKAVSLAEETPTVDPNMLFLYLEDMRKLRKKLRAKKTSEKKKKAKRRAAEQAAQLKCMIKYLDKDYATTKKTLHPLLEAGNITFDLLWTLFRSETIVYTTTYGSAEEPRAFKVEYATKESSFMKGTWYGIEGKYLDYDGKAFGLGAVDVEIDSFKGPRKISSLPCYPLKYHKDSNDLKKMLIERGRKFTELAGMRYKFHKGMGFTKRKRQVIKVSINGRVMVDPSTFRRINPNYPISTIKAAEGEFPGKSAESEDENECGCCNGDENDEGDGQGHNDLDSDNGGEGGERRIKVRVKVVTGPDGQPRVVGVDPDDGEEIDGDGDGRGAADENGIDEAGDNDNEATDGRRVERLVDKDGTAKREFSDEELLIASPVVLGFAFSEKLWLEFTVSGVHEIEWNDGAFDSLVLPASQKSIVRALVQSQCATAPSAAASSSSGGAPAPADERRGNSTTTNSTNIDDVIQGKGKGLVAVLHGTPGVGKTLTAEGIAELLRCPLYSVSAGELGTSPRELELELTKILDVAHAWGAVLLLDEADVFLEARTPQDIHRNALVSIFLRLLEYFQGIMILTTNRVGTFDDAFQSRIHIALRYQELDFRARRKIFEMFLNKVRTLPGAAISDFTPADLDRLARRGSLNGRQIKNAVRSAQALAIDERRPLSMDHVIKVLEVAESFERDLKGGTGFQDAMRSYM